MVTISRETNSETDGRLRRVIAEASLVMFDGSYAFEEFPSEYFATRFNPDALALVRDGDTWSQLVCSDDPSRELFGIFSFHFDGCPDNSGFVGWLATRFKETLGTGVAVICGHNHARGGIFDYWAYPASIRDGVIAALIDFGAKRT